LLLIGFPIGVAVPIIIWYIQKKLRDQDEARTVDTDGNIVSNSNGEVAENKARLLQWARQIHPIIFFYGGLCVTPYNISYIWPAVPIAFVSRIWVRTRFLAFWSRYNYVLSASFSTAIAIVSIIVFFGLDYKNISIDWWGNDATALGCEAVGGCRRLLLADGDHFGPGVARVLHAATALPRSTPALPPQPAASKRARPPAADSTSTALTGSPLPRPANDVIVDSDDLPRYPTTRSRNAVPGTPAGQSAAPITFATPTKITIPFIVFPPAADDHSPKICGIPDGHADADAIVAALAVVYREDNRIGATVDAMFQKLS
ncbi:hypothetical protein SEPCBS119000_004002, partial [Sporothrix epigloea]